MRPWGLPGDAGALTAAWADPEVARWAAVPEDRSAAAAERWVAGEGRRRAAGLAVDLVICRLAAEADVLGEVGLVMVGRARRWAEAGWWLTPDARGAGRAAASLRLMTVWSQDALALERLFARIEPANLAAGRVAERAGWRPAGTTSDGRLLWVAPRL